MIRLYVKLYCLLWQRRKWHLKYPTVAKYFDFFSRVRHWMVPLLFGSKLCHWTAALIAWIFKRAQERIIGTYYNRFVCQLVVEISNRWRLVYRAQERSVVARWTALVDYAIAFSAAVAVAETSRCLGRRRRQRRIRFVSRWPMRAIQRWQDELHRAIHRSHAGLLSAVNASRMKHIRKTRRSASCVKCFWITTMR